MVTKVAQRRCASMKNRKAGMEVMKIRTAICGISYKQHADHCRADRMWVEENLHASFAPSNGRIVKRKDLHKESFRTHNNLKLPGEPKRTSANCLQKRSTGTN